MNATAERSAARTATSHPQFLTVNGRRLFALLIEPTGLCHGAMLYLPPFAEEMNRCRSHVVGQARALAAAGWRTLLLDPFGTGESDGRISDANWQLWLDDAIAAARWLQALGPQPFTVWGLRTGALLACDVAASAQVQVAQLLLWQPVVDGKLFINQTLRLRIASQMVSATERETTEQIRSRLAAGEVIEVAGYPLSGGMADSIAARQLDGRGLPASTRIAWLDVVAKAEQPLAPASRRVLDALAALGLPVRSATVACPMIWQLHERADAPALVAATLGLLLAADEPAAPAHAISEAGATATAAPHGAHQGVPQ